ncbi:MAG TPA: ROK family protein [Pyrinomonadaceae bacterium]|jgi:glucokinase
MTEVISQTEKLVGVEVGGMMMKAVCLDAGGNLVEHFQSPIIKEKEIAPQLIDFIKELFIGFGDFEKIGITVPGLIDRDTKRVAFSTYFPEHEKIDLLGELEKVTKLKIFIENDANAAAYGEYRLGAGRGNRDMFYVTLGIGIGGALIFDGNIWRGASGFAGEFGHISINSDGMKLEDVASAANIIRRTRSRFHQDHTSSLRSIGEDEIGLLDVVREARLGDSFAQMMLERTGSYVGMAIASVINLLNVEKIVIGGVIMQAEHLVLDAIVRRARELSFPPSFKTTEISGGELGENATAAGVALLSSRL